MRRALLFTACLAASAPGHEFFSTKITWSREVSRIVRKSCAGCHRDGGAAFALATFEQARPWAAAIKDEVLSRRMPPWGAAKGFGDFRGDLGLSQDEIALIGDWVEGGAPEGLKAYLPAAAAPPPRAEAAPAPRLARRAMAPGAALTAPLTLAGIAPRGAVPAGARITAELPDGSVVPLIWIVDPAAASRREFLFREPKALPKGSRFAASKSGGEWKLLLAP